MSSLRNKLGVLDWWSSLARFCTNRKLSWMHLFLMKALWLLEIMLSRIGACLLAMSLEKIFVRLWIRLIGR